MSRGVRHEADKFKDCMNRDGEGFTDSPVTWTFLSLYR
jgi:hypothetical protein